MSADDLTTDRLRLVALDAELLGDLASGRPVARFTVPEWWPDRTDRGHLDRWLTNAVEPEHADHGWGPRAIVHRGSMVGHIGFHGPPVSIAAALDDPSFEASIDPILGPPPQAGEQAAVEVGYTVFGEHRGRGFATEALVGLIAWAEKTGRVSTILATVLPTNEPSLAVLERAGGFLVIGSCRDENGEPEVVYRRDLC